MSEMRYFEMNVKQSSTHANRINGVGGERAEDGASAMYRRYLTT